MPDLFGSQMKGEALGANGEIGFNGGNTAILGANNGIQGTGLINQFMGRGENGGVGYFTGAQKDLEGFANLLKQNNVEARIAHGLLEANFGEKSSQSIIELWQTYADGLESAVLASDVLATQLTEGNIRKTNLMYENFTTASGLNAFQVRDNLLTIDKAFDSMVDGGMNSTDALFKSMSDGFGWTLDQTQQFLDKSGVSLESYIANFSNASGETLRGLLDFNAEGVTSFESGIQKMGDKTNAVLKRLTETAQNESRRVETAYTGSFDNINRSGSDSIGNLVGQLRELVAAQRDANNNAEFSRASNANR